MLYTMSPGSRGRATIYFSTGMISLVMGMIIEFLLAVILPTTIMQTLWVNGGFIILVIIFFGAGLYFVRKSILGYWRYHYDSIIYLIAATILFASSIQTVAGLQIGHPYLQLAETNPLLMYLLWIFVLPPLNPFVMTVLGFGLLFVAWINLRGSQQQSPLEKLPGFKINKHKPLQRWWILGQLTRVSVWIGSILLLILAFLILGGPPLSHPSLLLLSDPLTWGRLFVAIFAAALLNSGIFIINQISDLDTDQLHPQKSQLPISSGYISLKQGLIITIFCIIASLGLALLLVGFEFFIILSAIIVFGILYSVSPIRLKSRPFVDLVMIGIAFGSWSVMAAWAILFFLPEIPLALLIGPGLFYAGTHSIHTASDYPADSQAGVQTTAVYLGPKQTSRLGILLIALGFLCLYIAVGLYTHLFWYGLLKLKSIFLFIFCGLPFFALFQLYRKWQQAGKINEQPIQWLQTKGRKVAYLLFLILMIYLFLYVFLFYPTYYPNYNFPWS
jgi:4-hydroxybenzoate polyprenyltransferase